MDDDDDDGHHAGWEKKGSKPTVKTSSPPQKGCTSRLDSCLCSHDDDEPIRKEQRNTFRGQSLIDSQQKPQMMATIASTVGMFFLCRIGVRNICLGG